jgi:hypothetical protein
VKQLLEPTTVISYAFGGAPESGQQWIFGTSTNLVPQGMLSDYFTYQSPLASEAHINAAQTLRDISHLTEDWDGYGALQVSTEALASAYWILSNSYNLPVPEFTPTANGTLGVEWKRGEKEAYVEVGKTRVSGYVKPTASKTYYVACASSDAPISLSAIIHGILTADEATISPITPLRYK